MADWLETFREVTASKTTLQDIHPLKLDRWHRTLLELPDAVYMQLDCSELLRQVEVAAEALGKMLELLGRDNLPGSHSEIARRNVRTFSWLVTIDQATGGTIGFHVVWDPDVSSWRLSCGLDPNTTKQVPDVSSAVSKALEWVDELAQYMSGSGG